MAEKDRLRNLIVSTLKRSLLDIAFVKSVEEQNNLLDSHGDFLLQCSLTMGSIQAILDYNFYPEDVEDIDPYQADVVALG